MKMRLDARVRDKFQVSWGKARGWIETGKIWVNGNPVTDPGAPTDESAEIELKMNAPKPKTQAASRAALPPSEVVFEDTQIIVVRKPAGVNSVPFEKDETDSLEQRVSRHLNRPAIVVHRLDRETSGLLVFAKTKEAGKHLANQFRFHNVLRRYFALAHGNVRSQTIRSDLVENRGDGLRGSLRPGTLLSRDTAKPAVTHVLALEPFNGMTLVECELETGRTHQIRIHLSEAGHPLLGERGYNRDHKGPWIDSPRLMLHAAELGFTHPTRETLMRWAEPPPEDFLALLSGGAKTRLMERLKNP